jgi:hypothetical protein
MHENAIMTMHARNELQLSGDTPAQAAFPDLRIDVFSILCSASGSRKTLTSLRRSQPSASMMALPCSSLDIPSSSLSPSMCTLPEVPATYDAHQHNRPPQNSPLGS